MTLPLTPEMLRAAYDFLATTPPFNRWNLPDGEDVVFRVIRTRRVYGWQKFDGDRHTIALSRSVIGHTDRLLETMAHEMIHVHEDRLRGTRSDVEHSTAFRKWSTVTCRYHGWDPRGF